MLEAKAVEQDFAHVLDLWVEIRRGGCLDPHALSFCFESASKQSLAEGARLHIEEKTGLLLCSLCGCSIPGIDQSPVCPRCGCATLKPDSTREFILREIEVV